jgi:hypothetical protein
MERYTLETGKVLPLAALESFCKVMDYIIKVDGSMGKKMEEAR